MDMRKKLKPLVKSPRLIREGRIPPKLREGKGFSLAELEEAGLTVDKAKRLRIYVDKRRRSKHKENVEALKRLIENKEAVKQSR